MENLFVLSYSHYEETANYYLEGPEGISQKDFQNICDNLLDDAAFQAVLQNSLDQYLPPVGWPDIVEILVPLLEKQGFKLFKPKMVDYWGSGIIQTKEDAKKLTKSVSSVIKHNKRFTE